MQCGSCYKGRKGIGSCVRAYSLKLTAPACRAWEPIPKADEKRKQPERTCFRSYENTECPVCGAEIKRLPSTVHCPAYHAIVCMMHCYQDCGYLDVRMGHCRYTDEKRMVGAK